LVLLLAALVLLLSLVSFDAHDLSSRAMPPNDPPHNWLGRFGAGAANWLLFFMGNAAFLTPVLAAALGFACLIPSLAHLRRGFRAPLSALGLVIACIGLLDLFRENLPPLAEKGNSVGAGGVLGHELNKYVVFFVNRPGAMLAYLLVYLGSMIGLTNINRDTLRRWFTPKPADPKDAELAEEKRTLEEKAKAVAKRTKAVESAAKTASPPAAEQDDEEESAAPKGVGADLKPVPEPKFQDNSVPRPPASEAVTEGTTISAEEIRAKSPAPAKPESPKTDAPPWETDSAGVEEDAEDAEPLKPAAPSPSGPRPAPARGQMQLRRNKPITVATAPMIGNYKLPSLDLLQLPDLTVKPTETKEELMANSRLMVQTLAQFGIEVMPGDITRGPTITRFELHPAPGVKLERIAALTNNIAAALKAERINVLAPIPGKSSVGVEVPNAVKTKVIMRDLLESPEWKTTKARVPLALGKDVYGQPIIADLADMPHLLIAGSTGSGKSVCINTIIASLLYRFSPDQLRFVMIDPKVVELQQYNALPHLVVPVVTDPKKVVLALRWVVNEMEKRYQIFAKVGVRNIRSFNERPKDKPLPPKEPELPLTAKKEKVEPGADGFAVEVDEQIVVPRDDDVVIPDKLSYIVVIIDELADLMLVAPADVEMAIARITQMARAAGIHCIVATQRPSVDVITGVIKANIPARIAFQVASKVDSRTILDQMGADKLLGKGDMLYLPPGSGRLNRAQGALITDHEIEQLVAFIAGQGKPSYEVDIHQALQKAQGSMGQLSLDPDGGSGGGGEDGDEELLERCIEVIRTEKKASVSLLQRRLKLGYGRASRLMDQLEDRGIVGPSKGAEPRDILIDMDGQGYDGGGQSMV
jgi:DNA segregation ATPase FtsK/SpoIIIE, S-DNA-T family